MKSSTRICLLQLLRFSLSLALLLAALIGFRVTYGATLPFFLWTTVFLIIAWLLRVKARGLAIGLAGCVVSGWVLWPVDAALRFPFLRTLHILTPFGPSIEVYPSPSGKSTAYVYNHSFLDRAYSVRFAHGLEFPGRYHNVPLGRLDYATISTQWEGNRFNARASGLGITLIYDENSRHVTYPKGGEHGIYRIDSPSPLPSP